MKLVNVERDLDNLRLTVESRGGRTVLSYNLTTCEVWRTKNFNRLAQVHRASAIRSIVAEWARNDFVYLRRPDPEASPPTKTVAQENELRRIQHERVMREVRIEPH